MPKPLIWTLRLALLLLTPLFLVCAGVARWMMWLDAWAVDQLAGERATPASRLEIVRREALEECARTERGGR